jgi:hypothetical protein
MNPEIRTNIVWNASARVWLEPSASRNRRRAARAVGPAGGTDEGSVILGEEVVVVVIPVG